MTDDVHLDAVSETLFLPLYAPAPESRRTTGPIMVDKGAVDLKWRLNEFFVDSDKRTSRRVAKGRLPSTLLTTVSFRIRRFDRYVAAFLEQEPDGVVVSLGCGLDDRGRLSTTAACAGTRTTKRSGLRAPAGDPARA